MSASPTPPVLIIEDLDFDYEMAVRGFRQLGMQVPFVRHANLSEAVSFLKDARQAADKKPLPGVVILDLQLQDGDGREILSQLKADEDLKSIPVVVWSASSDPTVIESCYREGASSYICKAVDRRESENAVQQFAQYWKRTVTQSPRP